MPCSADIAQAIVDLLNDDHGVTGLAFQGRGIGGQSLISLQESRLCLHCGHEVTSRNHMRQFCSRACYDEDRLKGKTDEQDPAESL